MLGAARGALLAYASLVCAPGLLGRRPFLRLPQTRNQIHRAPFAGANPPSGRWSPGHGETAPAFSPPLLAPRARLQATTNVPTRAACWQVVAACIARH